LITRTMIRIRRWRACSAEKSIWLWQQLSLTRRDTTFEGKPYYLAKYRKRQLLAKTAS
jgi:hypothetical protein